MSIENWNKEIIQKMIDDKIEESLSLDYKCAKAIENTKEITKDVSSFANSAGGVIIYGVKEFDIKENKHLPERIDPIKRLDMPKERLEHIINNIKPRLENLKIYPVSISDDDLVYVVEIEQSNTAHQAMDHRYYKRHNFQTVPMEDYELRDIMNRTKNPIIDLEFKIIIEKRNKKNETVRGIPLNFLHNDRDEIYTITNLEVYAKNNGFVYANYIHSYLWIPLIILISGEYKGYSKKIIDGLEYVKYHIDNSKRDRMSGSPSYGPKRFEPILPQMSQYLKDIILIKEFLYYAEKDFNLYWDIYADNTPKRNGVTHFNSIKRESVDKI
jgi:hypothetical protein